MTFSKRLFHIFRSLFISYEFAIFLFWFISHHSIEPRLNDMLKSNNTTEVIKYLGFLPAVVVAFSIKESSNILRPFQDEKMKVLLQWPLYRVFKDKFYLNIIIQIICAITSINAFMRFDTNKPYHFTIIIFVCTICLTSAASSFYGGGIELKNQFDLFYQKAKEI